MRNLIHRPIAVTMCLVAIAALGCIALRYIPISLTPDIDVPQITVQANMPGYSAREIDKNVVQPLLNVLKQVEGVKSVRSESRMDVGYVTLTFEPGSNTSLLSIDVNERIDRAMNWGAKDMGRPKVVRASATDIPAFYLDVYMKRGSSELAFAQLGQFVKAVVSKRIEQLPQTAMVDVSGTVGTEIVCIPNNEKLEALGLTTEDIEARIRENDITLEALSIVDGQYRYNIHFDSELLTKEDIESIYINHSGRLLQLKDLCLIEERAQERNGIVRHGKRDAVTMAIFKQHDAQMSDLRRSMEALLEELRLDYPDISFELTRDQTELLSFTMRNLQANLLAGVLLASLMMFLFMRQWRLSLLMVVSIPVSLVITLLCFYVAGISLNVLSLSGLILGAGMIVDNSIIVTDNVTRRWCGGLELEEAVIKGTKEMFTPMLSSVLTTCSVFLPLMLLSGMAGALLHDEALGVTIALFASLAVATLVIPVYFYQLYRKSEAVSDGTCGIRILRLQTRAGRPVTLGVGGRMYRVYERTFNWTFRHVRLCLLSLLCLALCGVMVFVDIEKEVSPRITRDDMLVNFDWNMGISATENARRTSELIASVEDKVATRTIMSGSQDFLLPHTKEITSSEAIVYLKAISARALEDVKRRLWQMMQQEYGNATVEYGEASNLYNLIFSADEADLEIRLQDKDGKRPGIAEARSFVSTLRTKFPDIFFMPVATERNIGYVADTEMMAVYKVGYEQLHRRLKELVGGSHIIDITTMQPESVPVVVWTKDRADNSIINNTVRNSDGVDVPIACLVRETSGEDYKRLEADSGGEYYNISIRCDDRQAEQVMDFVNTRIRMPDNTLTVSYAGGYFSSRQMIEELALVLSVALSLLYFILAAQFESLVQPIIVLTEVLVDVCAVFAGLWLLGETLNVMSMIGIVVMSGIIINDSILKIDTINRYRRGGMTLLRAILLAGHDRLKSIVLTSLTTILAILPLLGRGDMGSDMQYPLSLTLIIGMTVGTLVSLLLIPLLYYIIYNRKR